MPVPLGLLTAQCSISILVIHSSVIPIGTPLELSGSLRVLYSSMTLVSPVLGELLQRASRTTPVFVVPVVCSALSTLWAVLEQEMNSIILLGATRSVATSRTRSLFVAWNPAET